MTPLWPYNVARLTSKGGLSTRSKEATLEDVYTLLLSDPAARPSAGSFGIPAIGQEHSPDAASTSPFRHLYVKDVEISQPDPTSQVWVARVKYTKKATSTTGSGPEADTTVWTRARIGFQPYQEPLTTDSDGKAVVNSAGDAFEDAPSIDRNLLEIDLARNESSQPGTSIISLNDTINASSVTILGMPIEARCGRVSIEAEKNFADGSWVLSFRILVNPATWDAKVLQNGYRYLDNGLLVKFTEKTADGREVECSSPQLLGPEGDGGDGRGRGPYYATFKPYAAASWSPLKLPSNAL